MLLLARAPSGSDEHRSGIYNSLSPALYDCYCYVDLLQLWEDISKMNHGAFPSIPGLINLREVVDMRRTMADALGATDQEDQDRMVLTVISLDAERSSYPKLRDYGPSK